MTQPHTPQPEDSHTRSKSPLGELLVKALDLVSRLVKAEISAVPRSQWASRSLQDFRRLP